MSNSNLGQYNSGLPFLFKQSFTFCKYITVNIKMDPRLYTYQYRRPRLSNPTYISNNVNNSLTYYMNNPIAAYPPSKGLQSNNYPSHPSESKDGQRQQSTPVSEPMAKNRSAYLENGNKKPRYEENIAEQTPPHQYDRQSSMPKMGQDYNQDRRSKAYSNLSNYGSNVVNNSSAFKGSLYNDQQIFRRQDKKFNIITLKPNQFQHAIKQFPKLTLEDKDAYFFKKMQQQQLIEDQQARIRQQEMQLVNGGRQNEHQYYPQQYDKSAGKPTFSQNPQPDSYHAHPNPKILNNLDELGHI